MRCFGWLLFHALCLRHRASDDVLRKHRAPALRVTLSPSCRAPNWDVGAGTRPPVAAAGLQNDPVLRKRQKAAVRSRRSGLRTTPGGGSLIAASSRSAHARSSMLSFTLDIGR